MVFTATIPKGDDNISTSQGQLLGNNAFLGNFATLTGQVAAGSGSKLSSGGFYKFPNGLIVQFFTITNAGNVGDGETYPFLTPFTNVNSIQVFLQGVAHSAAVHDVIYVDSSGGSPVTTTNFTVITSTTWGNVYVFAIGK